MTTINNLKEKLGNPIAFDLVKRKKDCFAQNTEGGVTAISLSENSILSELMLDKEADSLVYLSLSGIKSLTKVVFDKPLPCLTHLYLDNCSLTELVIPKDCEVLKHIYLQKNKLINLVFQGDCPDLELLDVSGNQLADFSLPYGFDRLAYLYLTDNQLKTLSLNHALAGLTILHLRKNQLNELPAILLESEKMETLYVHGNPMERMDKNVLADGERDNSWASVRNYLSSLSDGTIEYDQVKLIVLGNSTAGKSSLIYFLKDKLYEYGRASTHGMMPIIWEVNKDLKVAVWDFGGQEYYHNIHHLFFTNKCLYVVVFEGKTNCQGTQLTAIELYENGKKVSKEEKLAHFHYDYWLDNIQYLTQTDRIDSPQIAPLLIQNKMDLPPNERDAQAHFRISVEKSFEGHEDYLYAYKDFERQLLKKLKDTKGAVPVSKKWLTIKNKIQAKAKEGKPFLTKKEYVQLAEKVKAGIARKADNQVESELDTLTQTLQRTGVIVYYPEIKDLKDKTFDLADKIFISPEWLTDSIYRVLDYAVQQDNGQFTLSHVREVIKEKTINGQHIKAVGLSEQEIIALMKGFELIFELNPTLNRLQEPTFIAPQYLPETCTEPRSIAKLKEDILKKAQPTFSLAYPSFMPKSVMPRFIAKNGSFSKNPCWQYGINYALDATEILVECDFDNKLIHVWIEDKATKEALAKKVFDDFLAINNKKPKVCVSMNNKDWVEIGKLRAHQTANKKIETTVAGVWVDVDEFAMFLDKDMLFKHFEDEIIKNKSDMTINELKKQVGNYVGDAKIEKAIQVIESWASTEGDSDARKAITMIKGNWTSLRKKENMGIAENERQQHAAISYSILNYDWSTETAVVDEPEPVKAPEPKQPETAVADEPKPVKTPKPKQPKPKKVPEPLESKAKPRKMLFLGANPFRQSNLQLHREYVEISDRLKDKKQADKFDMHKHMFTRRRDFMDAIIDFQPQIIHFAGHGKASDEATAELSRAIGIMDWQDEGGLIFHDRDYQEVELVNAEDLEGFFENFVVSKKIPIEIVVLNACYSAKQAQVIAKHVKYVVGMRNTINDEDGIEFSYAFYGSLARGESPLQAYNDGKALVGASKAKKLLTIFIDGQEKLNP